MAAAILAVVPTALEHPAVLRVLDAAARKGVTLDITVFADSTHTEIRSSRGSSRRFATSSGK